MLKYSISIFVILSIFFTNGNGDNMNVYRFSKQFTRQVSPTVSAVLMECPKKDLTPVCKKKIVVNIRVSPSQVTGKLERYLILDEIYDPKKKSRAKLMSPYLIEITRGEPILMYPLKFSKDLRCMACGVNKTRSTKLDNVEKPYFTNLMQKVNVKHDSSVKEIENFKEDRRQESKLPQSVVESNPTVINKGISNKEDVNRVSSGNHIPKANKPRNSYEDYNINDNIKKGAYVLVPDHSSVHSKGPIQSDYPMEYEDYYNEIIDNYNEEGGWLQPGNQKDMKQKPQVVKHTEPNNEHRDIQPYERQPQQLHSTDGGKGSGKRQEYEVPFQEGNEESSDSGEFQSIRGKNNKVARKNNKGRSTNKNPEHQPQLHSPQKHEMKVHEEVSKYGRNSGLSSYDDSQYETGDYDYGKRTKIRENTPLKTQVERFELKDGAASPNASMREHCSPSGKAKYSSGLNGNQILNNSPFHHTDHFRYAPGPKSHDSLAVDKRSRAFEREKIGSNLRRKLETQRRPNIQFSGHDSNNGAHLQRDDKNLESYNLPSSSSFYPTTNTKMRKDAAAMRSYRTRINDVAADDPGLQTFSSSSNFKVRTGTASFVPTDNRIDKIYDYDNHISHNTNDKFGSSSSNFRDKSFLKQHQQRQRQLQLQPQLQPGREQQKEGSVPANDNSFRANEEERKENERRGLDRNESGSLNPRMESGEHAPGRMEEETRGHLREYNDEYDAYYDENASLDRYPNMYKNNQNSEKFPVIYKTHASGQRYKVKDVRSPESERLISRPKVVSNIIVFADGDVPQDPEYRPRNIKHKTRQNKVFETHQESPDEKIFADVPQDYLPQPVPFEEVIDDPNLNTDDKMQLIEIIDPKDEARDKVLKYFENEIQNSHFDYDLTKNDRAPIPAYKDHQKRKGKRSYFLYNDLTVDDAYQRDYDYVEAFKDTASAGDNQKSKGDPQNSVGGSEIKAHSTSSNAKEDKSRQTTGLLKSVSDVWYSVYDTSAPLQYLSMRVRIFRKKDHSWWKIVPSITLTTLSGTFANANLSILFSSRAEAYTSDNFFNIENYKILIPKADFLNPEQVLAVEKKNWKFEAVVDNVGFQENLRKATLNNFEAFDSYDIYKRSTDGFAAIKNFGEFPISVDAIGPCKHNRKDVCLNLLQSEVPAYKLNIQLPFVDNDIVRTDYYNMRITNIISDATTRGSVELVISVVSDAFVAHELSVIIFNCPVTCGAKNIVRRRFPPHHGETITFLLPLQDNNPNSKFYCEVHITKDDDEIIARRQMMIQPAARCLCIWHCKCNCFSSLISGSLSDVCQTYQGSLESGSTFALLHGLSFSLNFMYGILMFFVLFSITLVPPGLLKACCGCCCKSIGKWKFHYFSPSVQYEDASRCRRFCLNTMFFLSLPFLTIWRRCAPTEDDLLLSSTSWECPAVQHDFAFISDDEDDIEFGCTNFQKKSSSGQFEPFLNPVAEGFHEDVIRASRTISLPQFMLDDTNDEEDTNFVIKTLDESRDVVEDHHSEEVDPSNPKYEEAKTLVERLLLAKIVYRRFKEATGNAYVAANNAYSIRGYFIPAVGAGYQFISHTPLRQHWEVGPDVSSLRRIVPPIMLKSKDFARNYANKIDVLEADDLSLNPTVSAPCINVLVQSMSMYSTMRGGNDATNAETCLE